MSRTSVSGGLRAELRRVAVVGKASPITVLARFRLTNDAGKSLPLVREIALAVGERQGKPEPPTRSHLNTPDLTAQAAGVTWEAARAARTFEVTLKAAEVQPSHTWWNVPVPAADRDAGVDLPTYSSDAGRVNVRIERSASHLVLGTSQVPQLTITVTEVARERHHGSPGFVRVEGSGLISADTACIISGRSTTWGITVRPAHGSVLPDKVHVRYVSSVDVEKALKPYRFRFSGIDLGLPPAPKAGPSVKKPAAATGLAAGAATSAHVVRHRRKAGLRRGAHPKRKRAVRRRRSTVQPGETP